MNKYKKNTYTLQLIFTVTHSYLTTLTFIT